MGQAASWGLGTSTQLSVPCDRRGWVTRAHSTPRLGHSRASVIEHPILSVIVLMPHGSLKDPMFDLSYSPLFQDSFLSKHSDFPLKWYLLCCHPQYIGIQEHMYWTLPIFFFAIQLPLWITTNYSPLNFALPFIFKIAFENLLESKAWTSCGGVQLMILLGRRQVKGCE